MTPEQTTKLSDLIWQYVRGYTFRVGGAEVGITLFDAGREPLVERIAELIHESIGSPVVTEIRRVFGVDVPAGEFAAHEKRMAPEHANYCNDFCFNDGYAAGRAAVESSAVTPPDDSADAQRCVTCNEVEGWHCIETRPHNCPYKSHDTFTAPDDSFRASRRTRLVDSHR